MIGWTPKDIPGLTHWLDATDAEIMSGSVVALPEAGEKKMAELKPCPCGKTPDRLHISGLLQNDPIPAGIAAEHGRLNLNQRIV